MRSYAKSIALHERTRTHLAGGVSSNVRSASTPVPLFLTRGEGARLYDVDGNVHVDYVLGNGPAILGHAPRKIIEAVAASLAVRVNQQAERFLSTAHDEATIDEPLVAADRALAKLVRH